MENFQKMISAASCNDYLKTLGYISIAFVWIKILEKALKL